MPSQLAPRAARVAAFAVAMAAWTSPAAAQPADVTAQIKLIETQPPDLDRASWKDRRRDAARKLGQSRDKRAVTELIKLAETETFDIIGEIAIEALGNLGDPSAAPVLQKISADPTRDKDQRDLARKALAKLGAPLPTVPSAPPAPMTNPPSPRTSPASTTSQPSPSPRSPATASAGSTTNGSAATSSGSAGIGTTATGADSGDLGAPRSSASASATTDSDHDLPPLPTVPDDALAAYERITFAGGTANLSYDSARHRSEFDADVAGQYQKRVERESMAWGWDASAHLVTGYLNPDDGPTSSRGAELDLAADGEARLYRGAFYGIGRAAFASQITYVADIAANPNNNLKNTQTTADLQLAIGGGYGRLLDIGAQIRVRQLARALEANHALGKPIDPATSRRLELTWWALRGERSSYRALIATVAILREAGILLGEPDAGLSYEVLNVLRDSQLYLRPSGLDLQLVFSEGYLQRPDQPPPTESGRVEQLLAQASYGAQLADDKLELTGSAYARLRLFNPMDQPAPWAAGATAGMRRFTYGDHGDPFGALDLTATLEVSNDDLMIGQAASQTGQRLTAQLGFTYAINQASGIRLAASLGEDRGAIFLGAQLTATYGLLDGAFAR